MSFLRRLRCALALLALFVAPALAGSDQPPPLRYRLVVQPGSYTIDQLAIQEKNYREWFTFTVANLSPVAFHGSAPTCQIFDVEVFRDDPSGDVSVWKWSSGQAFCQVVSPVNISPKTVWTKVAAWGFKAHDVKPGKYRAVATFLATHGQATVEFVLRAAS